MSERKTRARAIGVFLGFALMSAAVFVRSNLSAEHLNGEVKRGSIGQESVQQTLMYQMDGVDYKMNLDVSAVQPDAEHAQQLLVKAVEEWESSYLGKNPSQEEVRSDLILPDTLCDGLVTVQADSSMPDILNQNGHIDNRDLPEEGVLVEWNVTFTCGGNTRTETRVLHVHGPEKGSPEWLQKRLELAVHETEADSRTQNAFALPAEVDGHAVSWQSDPDNSWIILLVLGAAASVGLRYAGKEAERKKHALRMRRLMYEYPLMVDQMTVLLESGMTIRRVWEHMVQSKTEQGQKTSGTYLYLEEMQLTEREMREGRSQQDAYERFGSRIGLMPYRRLASVLSRNLTRGTRDLTEQLRKESETAFEMRRNRARKEGEEAGTKMLFPMMGMLVLLLLVLLFPAAAGFR